MTTSSWGGARILRPCPDIAAGSHRPAGSSGPRCPRGSITLLCFTWDGVPALPSQGRGAEVMEMADESLFSPASPRR